MAFLVVFLVETSFPAAELEPDEGGGVLLSELLETTQTDLVRIEAELGRLRSELGDDEEPQV